MGQRSKIDLLKLTSRVVSMYNDLKMTYEQIAETLRGEGYDVSQSSVGRYLSKVELQQEFEESRQEARLIVDMVREGTGTDTIEASCALLAHRLYQRTRAGEFGDPDDLFEATSKLALAQTRIGRLRLDARNVFEAAREQFLQVLSRELQAHPDLLERMRNIIATLEPPEVRSPKRSKS